VAEGSLSNAERSDPVFNAREHRQKVLDFAPQPGESFMLSTDKEDAMEAFLRECMQSVLDGDAEKAEKLAHEALDREIAPLVAIEKGFVKGIREIGRLWEEGVLFLPELVMGAEAMKRAMAVLQPALAKGEGRPKSLGHVVIGTIEGDIHDIGKTLVATMLSANGFEITDLGADVPVNRFIDEAQRSGAGCVAVSALLTTTMAGQKRVVEELARRSLRGRVKIMVGGAPCSEAWAREIGADGYAGDAVAAVALAQSLIGGRG
jgi:corrinoid protein of di/trimethylamine methyltransferase